MRVDYFMHPGPWSELPALVKQVEQAGFDHLCAPDIIADPFTPLALASQHSERLGLRTAIAVAFPRSPMVVAQTSWAIHANSGGRFAVGLGTQVKGHNERRFSVPWGAPRQRLREYAESLKAIWRCWQKGEPLNYEGEHYRFTLMTPEFSPKPVKFGRIPIHFAAVRPKMLRTAGAAADGVRLHGFCTRKYLEETVMPALSAGIEESGRKREDYEVCGGGFVITGPDEQSLAKGREWVRYRIAFYGSTRTYSPVMETHGWHDLAAKLHRMSKEGKWKQMAGEVPDDVVDHFAAIAPFDGLKKVVEERFGGLSDSIELGLLEPEQLPQVKELLPELQAIPSPFKAKPLDWLRSGYQAVTAPLPRFRSEETPRCPYPAELRAPPPPRSSSPEGEYRWRVFQLP